MSLRITPARRRFPLAAAAITLALGASALTACAPGSDSEGTGTADTLVVGSTISLQQVDPFQMQYKTVQNNVFDPLVRIVGGEEPEARLAESWEQTDDLTWDFKLRQGVTFHDGTELTADDVVFSFDYPRENTTLVASLILNLDKVTKVDEETVRITTKTPDPLLLNSIAYISIVPEATYTELGPEGFAEAPIGTGPYTLVDTDSSTFANMKAYDGFWGEKAKTENIELRFFSDPNSLASALESGQVEVGHEMVPTALKVLEGNSDFEVSSGYSGNQNMLTFNSTKGAFADEKVREAANHAIDADALVEALTYGAGLLEDGQLAIEGINGYTEEITRPEFDQAKAKALLAEAGAEGAKITIAGASLYKPLLEAIGAQLSEVGFKPTIQALEISVWLEQLREGSDSDIFYKGVSDMGFFDIERPFSQLARGTNAMVKDPKWDELYTAQRTELDPAKRMEAIQEASEYVADQDYVLWTYGRPSVNATTTDVEGLDFSTGLMLLFDDAVKND
ncbi:ABC transporter substrate-binding protein [Nocardioides dubius]|uniref:ABC transporter substrate-binding protein n=1 Tax=Nocardioides dubius TaxID=317019 RepID=A0ABN1TMM7_9ACTN